jgi:hypothetical protein
VKKAKKASKPKKIARKTTEKRGEPWIERIIDLERRVTRLEMGELHEDDDGPTLIAPK